MRLKGDPIVNAAMDNTIEREGQFVRKGSVVVRAQKVHETAMHMTCLEGEFPSFPDSSWDKEKGRLTNQIKATVKALVRSKAKESNITHLNTLIKQGEFLKLSIEEKQQPVWKSFIWNSKSGMYGSVGTQTWRSW